jgi:hypothetical protein
MVFLASNVGAPSQACAGQITVQTTIAGTAEPWNFVGGVNTNFQYGINDGTAPDVLSASNGFSFAPGGSFTLTYVHPPGQLGGTVSNGAGFPFVDPGGNTSLLANDFNGSSGHPFQSFYFDHATYPAYVAELVGTFANSTGAIVGTPFPVSLGTTVTVPVGATQLQLGINDDIFSDNRGSFTFTVTGPAFSAVPEPSTLTLAGLAGLALSGYASRRRRASAG